jgi:CO dehydrogenase/acetyl-CoA synthase epsilon subunit
MSLFIDRLKNGQEPEIEATLRRLLSELQALSQVIQDTYMKGPDIQGAIDLVVQLTLAIEYIQKFLPTMSK